MPAWLQHVECYSNGCGRVTLCKCKLACASESGQEASCRQLCSSSSVQVARRETVPVFRAEGLFVMCLGQAQNAKRKSKQTTRQANKQKYNPNNPQTLFLEVACHCVQEFWETFSWGCFFPVFCGVCCTAGLIQWTCATQRTSYFNIFNITYIVF